MLVVTNDLLSIIGKKVLKNC